MGKIRCYYDCSREMVRAVVKLSIRTVEVFTRFPAGGNNDEPLAVAITAFGESWHFAAQRLSPAWYAGILGNRYKQVFMRPISQEGPHVLRSHEIKSCSIVADSH